MLHVEQPGLLTTVQDLGRYGYERFGVPASGAMDAFALRAANALVGNPAEAAALEIGLDGVTLTASEAVLIAVTGAGEVSVRINGRALPAWSALFVRARESVKVVKPGAGWAYLAVRGGIEVPLVLGSRATYLRGRFGGLEGRALRAGDTLPIGRPVDARWAVDLAGRTLPAEARPRYGDPATVEVIPGPQLGRFSHEALARFLSETFTVSAESDRMGYRLSGPSLAPGEADLISEAMPLGAIQVPASGQPLVMLADRPTTGGYPKIATIIRADVPLLAQCPPDTGRVRFRTTTLEAAQAKYRAQLASLQWIEVLDEY